MGMQRDSRMENSTIGILHRFLKNWMEEAVIRRLRSIEVITIKDYSC